MSYSIPGFRHPNLPKNKLGRQMLKKLKVYRGPDHEHAAQKPEKIDI